MRSLRIDFGFIAKSSSGFLFCDVVAARLVPGIAENTVFFSPACLCSVLQGGKRRDGRSRQGRIFALGFC